MQLRKIPGVRSYRSNPAGVRELGLSSGMSSAAQETARQVASAANARGSAQYGSGPAEVRAGHENERRAGARVYAQTNDFRDARDRVLLSVAEQMVRRTG